jgi:hypothetical protein
MPAALYEDVHMCMYVYVHLWYLAELFLDWEMFQTKVVEKIEARIFNNLFFREIVLFMG